jgi:ketosteroid isomerase-like protein
VIHPEIEVIPARAAVQGYIHGHDGVRRFWKDNEENFDVFKPSYPELRHIDTERMVALGTVRARGRASGAEAEVFSAVVLDFREGKLVRFEDLGDQRAAMRVASSA